MPDGFFSTSTLPMLERPESTLLPQCGLCKLNLGCKSPKMEPTGRGKRKILVVAEAPGKDEDREGVQLVGNSGRDLMSLMRWCGVEMRRDCWLTNSLICRPPDNKIPNPMMVEWCRPNLIRTVNELQPEIIIPLGSTAVESVLGWLWKDGELGGIMRWAGYQIPLQKLNTWICPTYHPAFLLHSKDPVAKLQFHAHIKAALELKGRPWGDELPDYESQVEVIHNPDKAARAIKEITEQGGMAAFDYETNMLKPDSEAAKIFSCSIANKHRTIAYPWHGKAINATKQFLVSSDVRKVASNAKFEQRWTMKKLGVRIGGGKMWDTMLAAHAMENASKVRKITSIKFQAFVKLGMADYSAAVEPYLRTKTKVGNEPNRVHELDLQTLLLYNGLDSLLELKVARVQLKKLGYGK